MVRVGTAIFGARPAWPPPAPARPPRPGARPDERQGQARRLPRLRQHGRGPHPRARPGRRGARRGSIAASDVRGERLDELERQYGIQRPPDNAELVRQADVVILAVKPQIMARGAARDGSAVDQTQALISLAAGVSDRHGSRATCRGRAAHPRHAEHAGPGAGGRHRHRPSRRARRRRPRDGQRDLRAPWAAWSCSTRSRWTR